MVHYCLPSLYTNLQLVQTPFFSPGDFPWTHSCWSVAISTLRSSSARPSKSDPHKAIADSGRSPGPPKPNGDLDFMTLNIRKAWENDWFSRYLNAMRSLPKMLIAPCWVCFYTLTLVTLGSKIIGFNAFIDPEKMSSGGTAVVGPTGARKTICNLDSRWTNCR